MKAELLTIGDEILIGQIVNTNAVFLAKALNKIGIEVVQITSISDSKLTGKSGVTVIIGCNGQV